MICVILSFPTLTKICSNHFDTWSVCKEPTLGEFLYKYSLRFRHWNYTISQLESMFSRISMRMWSCHYFNRACRGHTIYVPSHLRKYINFNHIKQRFWFKLHRCIKGLLHNLWNYYNNKVIEMFIIMAQQ